MAAAARTRRGEAAAAERRLRRRRAESIGVGGGVGRGRGRWEKTGAEAAVDVWTERPATPASTRHTSRFRNRRLLLVLGHVLRFFIIKASLATTFYHECGCQIFKGLVAKWKKFSWILIVRTHKAAWLFVLKIVAIKKASARKLKLG